MLYFSKIKLFIIYLIIIFLSFFSLTNFIKNDNVLFSKKVNLGLDLQGGSYLLLEVDSTPILSRNLQEKLLDIRKYLIKDEIKYQNLKLNNDTISLELSDANISKFENFICHNKSNIY